MDFHRLFMLSCGNWSFRDVLKGIRAGENIGDGTCSEQGLGPMECRGVLEDEFQVVRPKRKYTRKAGGTQDLSSKAAKRKYTRKVKDPVANVGEDKNAIADSN